MRETLNIAARQRGGTQRVVSLGRVTGYFWSFIAEYCGAAVLVPPSWGINLAYVRWVGEKWGQ